MLNHRSSKASRRGSRTFFGECPYCHGKCLKKFGKEHGRKRWACANCGRTFSGRTRTILHSSKLKPSQIRRLASMLSDGAPLRQAAHQRHMYHCRPPLLVLAKSQFCLFSYSEKGAEAAGILMTVIRTARLNLADPEKYIAYVHTQLGKTGQEDIDRLLPWSESLPKEVRPSKYEVLKSVVDSIKKEKYE